VAIVYGSTVWSWDGHGISSPRQRMTFGSCPEVTVYGCTISKQSVQPPTRGVAHGETGVFLRVRRAERQVAHLHEVQRRPRDLAAVHPLRPARGEGSTQ